NSAAMLPPVVPRVLRRWVGLELLPPTAALFCGAVDVSEREARGAQAEKLVRTLVERDVSMVATTFVDNSGITRVKSVPLKRLPQLAAWGVGERKSTRTH